MPNRLLSRTRAAARAGFTLIELMAVVVIIGILMIYLLPKIPAAFDRAKVTSCKKNMSEIFSGLQLYYGKYNRVPKEGGVRFFAALITEEVWDASPADSKTLTCPGVESAALPGISELEPAEWFADESILNGDFSAYAGRDVKQYGLRNWPPHEGHTVALVADDNHGGANHRTTTVVLFGDGSVQGYEIVDERKKGHVGPEETTIVVGPESPIEELSKLSLD